LLVAATALCHKYVLITLARPCLPTVATFQTRYFCHANIAYGSPADGAECNHAHCFRVIIRTSAQLKPKQTSYPLKIHYVATICHVSSKRQGSRILYTPPSSTSILDDSRDDSFANTCSSATLLDPLVVSLTFP
jgi:hypothetical protein